MPAPSTSSTPSAGRLRRSISCADFVDSVGCADQSAALTSSTSSTPSPPAQLRFAQLRLASGSVRFASLSCASRRRLRRRVGKAKSFCAVAFLRIESFFESILFAISEEGFVWHATSCILFLNRLRTAQLRAERNSLSLSFLLLSLLLLLFLLPVFLFPCPRHVERRYWF